MSAGRSHDTEQVLVVEDDPGLRRLLVDELRDLELEPIEAASGEDALASLEHHRPMLVVSDVRLPGIDGMTLLERIMERPDRNRPAFVVITAFGSVGQAVEALKRGADDFLTKPLDLEHLRLRIVRLLEVQRLKRRLAVREDERIEFHGIIGASDAMKTLFHAVTQTASGRGPVTITGESGVGKELVARAVHEESSRRDHPFVPVNCASIPEALLESEFFGHESGAFTGASRPRQGLFAGASGGTLFLDEVAELPAPLQAKLLRVLQEGAVRRVGADREVTVDVRILAATNRDLEEEVAYGRFREDLFYRLSTFMLEVPPLRDREGDLARLLAHFVKRYARDAGKTIDGVEEDVVEVLGRYRFPGNVRELENLVEHAVTFCPGNRIRLDDLPARVRRSQSAEVRTQVPAALLVDDGLLTLDEAAQRYVRRVLELTGGNKRRAASLLGISRQTLYRYLSR
jgi:two-component system, NtrC family, response regulator AtoC